MRAVTAQQGQAGSERRLQKEDLTSIDFTHMWNSTKLVGWGRWQPKPQDLLTPAALVLPTEPYTLHFTYAHTQILGSELPFFFLP